MGEDIFHLGIKALIRDGRGRILLLRVNSEKLRGGGDYWDLPGGRIQKGQTAEETLRREVQEETGIKKTSSPREVGMVLSNIRIPLGDNESVGLILGIYECVIDPGAAITISDEHVAYDWFECGRAAELLAVKYPRHFCQLVANL